MKLAKLLALTIAGLGLFACQKDGDTDGGVVNQDPAEVIITLRATTGETYADGGTDAGEPSESEIKMLEFYIFNGDGTRDSENGYLKITNWTTGDMVNVKVTPDDDKKFLLAVNADLGALSGNYSFVKQTLAKVALDQTNSRAGWTGTGMAMSGETTARVSNNVPDNRVTLTVSRLVSKIYAPIATNVTVALDPEDQQEILPGTTSTPTFAFKGYALINGINKSDAFTYWNAANNENAAWDTWIPKNYLKSTFDAQGDFTLAYSGQENNSWWHTSATAEFSYVYESAPTPLPNNDGGMVVYDRNTVYAFIIKGDLSADGQTVERYWRVNLIRDDSYKTFRNALYYVTINNIVTKGYDTAEDAEEDEDNGGGVVDPKQTGVLVTINVAPWRIKLQGEDM